MKCSILKIAVLSLLVIVSLPALSFANTCPISVENPNNKTIVIKTPGGAIFKIDDYIKTLLPEAFDKERWTSAKLKNGAGKITGYLKTGKQEKVVSVFIALKRGNKTDWFLTVNKDLGSAQGKWLVANSINNNISCSEADTLEEVSISDSALRPYGLKTAKLKIMGADYVYKRLGL